MGTEQEQQQQPPQEQPPQEQEHEAEPPDWAKALIDDNKSLRTEIEGLKPKQPIQQAPQQQRDTNGNPKGTPKVEAPKENLELPNPRVAPKSPSLISRLPKWF